MPVGNGGGDLVKVFESRDNDLVELRCCAEPALCPYWARTGSRSADFTCRGRSPGRDGRSGQEREGGTAPVRRRAA